MPSLLRNTKTFLFIVMGLSAYGQNCPPGFSFTPVTGNNSIEWGKFPEFSLPFTIIYNAPRFGDTQSQPLKHGFSHLATFSGPEPGSLPAKNRAILWYNVATSVGNQPWADNVLRSPWGNDTVAYRNYWDNYASIAMEADIVCMDIERMQREDRDILALKSNTAIPQNIRNMSDQNFISSYKKGIRWWYTEGIERLRLKGPNTTARVTAYSDVPVRNTWLNITANSWRDWTSNLARTHYLTQNDNGQVGGMYYNHLDFLAPSPYYYYGYDNPIGKDFLSYLLFHVEVNQAWSDKPVIPFVWLRIHDSYDPTTPQILPFQAEATAIFPFFSGAKGLWLWENPFFPGDRTESYAIYEHFIYGLYRLSEYKDMFEGNYQLVINQSARDHMELQNPIWRGVVKDNYILVAAQNPYAGDNEETTLSLNYQKWNQTVKLKGKEILLCKYDLNETVQSTEPFLSDAFVYANPVQKDLNVALSGVNGALDVDFALLNTKGQIVLERKIISKPGMIREHITLPSLPPGMYFARFTTEKKTITRKVVVAQ